MNELETRAKELLSQLSENQLAAVVRLLEMMVEHGTALTRDDFERDGQRLSFDQVLAEFGLAAPPDPGRAIDPD